MIWFPALLPLELDSYQTASSVQELVERLKHKPADLVLFFETASDDETWSDTHLDLMRDLIDWITQRAFEQRLDHALRERAVNAIRKHYALLGALLRENITLQFKDCAVQANSLLLELLSSYFQQLLLPFSKQKKESFSLSLSCRYEQFVSFEYFMTRGEIPGLNQLDENALLALLSQAVQWDVGSVSEACQKMLCKYITRENAFERLLQAHQEHWTIFKQACMAFINSYAAGFFFYTHTGVRLGFEFISFTDKALQTFASFAAVITDLSFPGRLSSDPECIAMMRMVPHLVRLDLSRSHAFAAFEECLPEQLQELDLSECAWVEPALFKQIAHAVPHLCQLSLNSNLHLKYNAWGELRHFTQLARLDLAHCDQIGIKELDILLKACPKLLELNLRGIAGIEDAAAVVIGRLGSQLTALALSHCALTDVGLIELAVHCSSLRALTLSHCTQISDKGVLQLLRYASSLEQLDLTGCRLSDHVLQAARGLAK
jgi:F-box and leucine-rich repeat protein 2/20